MVKYVHEFKKNKKQKFFTDKKHQNSFIRVTKAKQLNDKKYQENC